MTVAAILGEFLVAMGLATVMFWTVVFYELIVRHG